MYPFFPFTSFRQHIPILHLSSTLTSSTSFKYRYRLASIRYLQQFHTLGFSSHAALPHCKLECTHFDPICLYLLEAALATLSKPARHYVASYQRYRIWRIHGTPTPRLNRSRGHDPAEPHTSGVRKTWRWGLWFAELSVQSWLRSENGQLLVANLTLYAQDGLPIVLLERFEELNVAVNCRDEGERWLWRLARQRLSIMLKTSGIMSIKPRMEDSYS